MCELYGFSGNRGKELNTDLRVFYSHAEQHPNGWGMALFDDTKADIHREPRRADKSDYLDSLLGKPITAKTALAHIRLATIGDVEQDNCHPFTADDNSGRRWTLIHNGTIFESDKLNKYIFLQKGETDSERILLYIIERMNEAGKLLKRFPTTGERFKIIDDIVCGSSPKNKLNLLIYDGEILYAHTNYRDSQYYREEENGVTFSTRPLSEGGWQNVPMTTLFGYKDGERLFTGTNHGNEYFFDPSTYKTLYMAYSGL